MLSTSLVSQDLKCVHPQRGNQPVVAAFFSGCPFICHRSLVAYVSAGICARCLCPHDVKTESIILKKNIAINQQYILKKTNLN